MTSRHHRPGQSLALTLSWEYCLEVQVSKNRNSVGRSLQQTGATRYTKEHSLNLEKPSLLSEREWEHERLKGFQSHLAWKGTAVLPHLMIARTLKRQIQFLPQPGTCTDYALPRHPTKDLFLKSVPRRSETGGTF